jgi:hypothetical protein
MLEPKSGRRDSANVIKDDIQAVLLTTDTVLLAAVGLNLDLDESLHLLVKRKLRSCGRVASVVPSATSSSDKVLEW